MAATILEYLKIKRSTRPITKGLVSCVSLFISLNLLSCEKINPITLPAATQNGSNTMGADINNVPWVPGPYSLGVGVRADYGFSLFGIFALTANLVNHSTKSMVFNVYDFNGVGKYALISSPMFGLPINGASFSMGTQLFPLTYITDSLHQGIVTVTHFDPSKKIVSGTFEMTLVNENDALDTIKITRGRFDFKCPFDDMY